jgi:hypothetical protein
MRIRLVAGACLATAAVGLSNRPHRVSVPIGANLFVTDTNCAQHTASCLSLGIEINSSSQTVALIGRTGGKLLDIPSSEVVFGAVWCRNERLCWRAGATNIQSRASIGALIPYVRGRLGTPHKIPGTLTLLGGVSCPTATVCWATAVGTERSTAPWAIVRINPLTGAAHVFALKTHSKDLIFYAGIGDPNGLVCTVRGACTAIGITSFQNTEAVATTLADGAITSITPIPGVAELRGLACPAPGVCKAVGVTSFLTDPRGVVVSLTGSVPSQTLTVAGTRDLSAIRCLPTSECIAVGNSTPPFHGAIVRLTGNQARVARVASIPTLSGVTCPTSTLCWTVGETVSIARNRLILAPFGPWATRSMARLLRLGEPAGDRREHRNSGGYGGLVRGMSAPFWGIRPKAWRCQPDRVNSSEVCV